ncbi:MAG: ATP-dependent zinc metalloprotease FtsH [Actinomycetota bacterium]
MRDTVKIWLLKRRRSRVAKKKGPGRRSTLVLSATLLVLLGAFAWSIDYLYFGPEPDGAEVSLDELAALSAEERVETAVFHDEDLVITGSFSEPAPAEEPKDAKGERGEGAGARNDNDDDEGRGDNDNDAGNRGERNKTGNERNDTRNERNDGGNKGEGDGAKPAEEPSIAPPGAGTYWASYRDPLTATLVDMVSAAGAEVSVDSQAGKQAVSAISTFLLPLMILANLFALLFSAGRGGGSGIGDVQMFGTIGRGKTKKGASTVSFDDVAGADEAVAELREVRDYLVNPSKYEELGAAPPKGVLLVGPPGCGKTLLAKAIAGEAGVPFFSVAGAEFVESLVGVGAARVRDLFARVRAVAPAILFIDELDAAGRKRGSGGGGGGSDEREQTLNQMLVEMDGFDVSSGVVVIGATNRPDILDPALLRPGRFDRHVTVDQPDAEGRQAILELHAKAKPLDAKVDFEYLAKRTPGFSGADLANVINEAALLTIREEKKAVEMPELEEAVQRVLAGPQKRGRILSDDERRRAAYHEGGHAVVSAASGEREEVHRVSILARGKGIGLTNLRKETDALLLTRSELFVQIVTAMGGLASEELVFGEHSTGAEQDLERATDIARDMVGRFGMGSKRRRLLARDVDEYIQGEVALSEISSTTHEEMEAEVDKLIHDAEKEASHILQRHRGTLDQLAKRLITEETLEGAELDKVLAPARPDIGRPLDTSGPGGRAGNGRPLIETEVPAPADDAER